MIFVCRTLQFFLRFERHVKTLLFLFVLTLTNTVIFAQDTTLSVTFEYNLNELDSKITAEVLALNRAKLDLAHQIQKYIDLNEYSFKDHNFNSDKTKTLIPCVVEIYVTKKEWTDHDLFLSVTSLIDTTVLANRLHKISRIQELLSKIKEIKNRSNKANVQIESLKRATLSDAFHQAEFQFLIEYTKNINVLKEEQLFHNGYLAYLSMEHDTSISYFKKLIELNPENDLGYYFIAQNYTDLGEDDDAIKYYTKTLQLSPRFAEATFNLGVLYTKKGNEYSANRYLSRAAKLNHKKAKMLLGPL